jgi:alkyl sulfatase BDS1-like metallo-beta-lactamase superfamily hydrolase
LLRQADPGDGEAWQTEAELCEALAIAERSTIVRGFYLSCARGARETLAELDEDAKPKR